MPYVTEQQKASYNELRDRRDALEDQLQAIYREHASLLAGIATEQSNLWLAVAEEHKMDLSKYRYSINGITGEILCLGGMEG